MNDAKTQLERQVDLEKRMERFNAGLKKLIEDTQITVAPAITVTEEGIRPIFKLKDLTPQPVQAPQMPPEAPPQAEKPVKTPKVAKNAKKKS